MSYRVLNPTNETQVVTQSLAPRLRSLQGANVCLISNGKEGTARFFAHLDTLLRNDAGVADVTLHVKSNYSAPADAAIMSAVCGFDAVIAGIGD